MQNVGKRTRGRYHSRGWWSCGLHIDEPAIREWSIFSIRNRGGLNLTNDPAIQAVGLPAFLLAGTGKAQYFWPGWNQSLPMAGLNGRTSDWTTGMLLGGGSSINGLYYGRGRTPCTHVGKEFLAAAIGVWTIF